MRIPPLAELSVLAALSLAPAPTDAQVRFAAAVPVSVPPVLGAHGPGPRGLVTGDFNGDGKTDVAVFFWDGNGGPGVVRLLLGGGDGSFRFQAQPADPSGYPGAIAACPFAAVGDMNGDGRDDLVCRDCYSIHVLLGGADGIWRNVPSTVTLPCFGTEHDIGGPILLGDVNGDRKLDLLGIAPGPLPPPGVRPVDDLRQVSLDLGMGDGTFAPNTPVVLPFVPSGINFALADLHGSGRPDVVVTDPTANRLYVLANQGNGTFQIQPQSYPAPYGQIIAADFNGDHRADLAIADFFGNTIQIYLGNGDGTLQDPIAVNAGPKWCLGTPMPVSCPPDRVGGPRPQQLTVADFNGDGKPDIAYLAIDPIAGEHLSLLMGRGDGRFAGPFTYPITPSGLLSTSPAMAVADFNGDGLPDVAVQTSTGFQVFLNTTPKGGNAGDVNGDGKITVGDAVLALRIALGLLTPTADQSARAEVTGDSVVSVGDVVVILRWAIDQLNPL